MALEYLFDAELEYRPGMAPLAEDGEGQLIGSGDGTVDGQRVQGALRWTLFEGPGELACTMNPTLAIPRVPAVALTGHPIGLPGHASRR